MGEITKPHGIRGAVQVISFCASPQDLLHYDPLYGEDHSVLSIIKKHPFKGPNFFLFFLEGVTSRNDAELWRGKKLYITRDQLPEVAEDDTFYCEDLMGLQVFDDQNNPLGQIINISNFGAQDNLVVRTNEHKEILIPFTAHAILDVNIEEGRVVVATLHII